MNGIASIEIQIQDVSGNWMTVNVTENQDQLIKRRLDEVVRAYRKRARAIDQRTRSVLDIRG